MLWDYLKEDELMMILIKIDRADLCYLDQENSKNDLL